MSFCEDELKARINEEEGKMINDGSRMGKHNRVKSKSWKDGEKEDLLQFTLRCDERFHTDFDQYASFPFDKLGFTYRFELSHFELKNEDGSTKAVIRFDYYRTIDNEISWKEECD